MSTGIAFQHAEHRRAKVGDVLVIALDDDRNVILYPLGGSPNLCTVYLEVGDEFGLDDIPSYLINTYRLDGLDMGKCVSDNHVWFMDHPRCGEVPLQEFAGWYTPVKLTVTRIVGTDHIGMLESSNTHSVE